MPKKTGGKSKKPVKLHVVKPLSPENPVPQETAPTMPVKSPRIIIKPAEIPKPEPVKITIPKFPEALTKSPETSPSPVTPSKQSAIPKPPEGIGTMELLIYIFVAFILGGVFFVMLFR